MLYTLPGCGMVQAHCGEFDSAFCSSATIGKNHQQFEKDFL
jgi:hypothetical protein